MIVVVSGIVIKDNRILMTQRLKGKSFEMRWETPGGKVENNEDCETALKREFHEELGGFNKIGIPSQYPFEVCLGDMLLVKFFSVWLQGPVYPKEGQGLGWFTIEEADALLKSPASYLVWPHIRKLM